MASVYLAPSRNRPARRTVGDEVMGPEAPSSEYPGAGAAHSNTFLTGITQGRRRIARGATSLATGISHGRIHAMKTTIDAAGRLVIPKEIRREAALEPGTPLEVRWRDGIIEIEPEPVPVTLAREGHVLVARARPALPTLRSEVVERTRQRLNRRGPR
jgi:AbrB family looped-hinge helix DNA binding protein